MPRVKRGYKARRRRNRILKAARGFYGGRSRQFSTAIEAVHRAWRYSTRDRKNRKRDFRRLWIVRINAACRSAGVPYGQFIAHLRRSNIAIDRKILADLAVTEPNVFQHICGQAQTSR